ncbi:MAG: TetR/AcrR family transcriptional regulator [Bdellovibrionaceae bacterium]|nr:TetR/AcrR family transcriptional regulator [Pseudobdellovibrionaceae bacterium]
MRISARPSRKATSQGNARERLIHAALKLFAERGPDAVSVKEISDTARINVSLISYYFGGKEGLLDAVLESLAESRLRDFDRILVKVDSAREFRVRLTLLLRNLIHFFRGHRELVRLFFEELERGQSQAEKINAITFRRLGDRLEAFLSEAKRAGFMRQEGNVKIIALQIFAPVGQLMRNDRSLERFHGISLYDPRFCRQLVRQIVAGVASAA